MKPKIFIGSSRESISIANKIAEKLNDVAECQLWHDNFFELNESYFASLTEGAILFDYGIFIASADDMVRSRDVEKQAARDNIIFEFGLYLGKLGKERSFFLKERGLDLPSDLEGIKLLEFDNSDDDKLESTLSNIASVLINHIEKEKDKHRLSFIPSTILAVGYHNNFLERVCDMLSKPEMRLVNGKQYSDFRLHVVVPDELPKNAHKKVKEHLLSKNLEQIKIKTSTREYPFYIDYSDSGSDILELYDLPTTVSGLKDASELAFPINHKGKNERADLLQRKELLNFCKALESLISDGEHTVGKVIVDMVDI